MLFLCLVKHATVKGKWRHKRGRVTWWAARPVRFTPGGSTLGTHWIRDWLGPKAVLEVVTERKRCGACREANPQLVTILAEIRGLLALLLSIARGDAVCKPNMWDIAIQYDASGIMFDIAGVNYLFWAVSLLHLELHIEQHDLYWFPEYAQPLIRSMIRDVKRYPLVVIEICFGVANLKKYKLKHFPTILCGVSDVNGFGAVGLLVICVSSNWTNMSVRYTNWKLFRIYYSLS